MSLFPTILSIIGGITLWCAVGYLQCQLFIKYDSDYDHESFIVPATMFWPLFTVVMPFFLLIHDGVPWLKKKWKAFRAPKVKEAKVKKLAKIKACPALKVKHYEKMLDLIKKDHEYYYRGRVIENAMWEYDQLRSGGAIPPVKGLLKENPEVIPYEGAVQARMWIADLPQAVPAGAHNVVHMPEQEPNEERW